MDNADVGLVAAADVASGVYGAGLIKLLSGAKTESDSQIRVMYERYWHSAKLYALARELGHQDAKAHARDRQLAVLLNHEDPDLGQLLRKAYSQAYTSRVAAPNVDQPPTPGGGGRSDR